MRGKLARSLAICLLSSTASLALAASSPATVTIGSNLRSPVSASEGICALAIPATTSRCTNSQATLAATHLARGGLTARAAGTILRWSVLSSPASPSTASVKLRLRVLDGDNAVGDASAYVELPLAQPGIHSFSTRLPVERGDRLAVESVVKSSGSGPAYAPIAHFEPAVGSVDEWIYPASPGLHLAPDTTREGVELLLSAEIDADRSPPRTKLTYANRQDFLRTHSAVVYLRSNEDATALAVAQLEWPQGNGPRAGNVIYQVQDARRKMEAGEKTALRLQVSRQTREAAERAIAHGKRVVVRAFVTATDAAGNRSGLTVASIRPKG